MNDLLIGVLSALMATNQPAALSNLVQQKTGLSLSIPDPHDPVEREYQSILEQDDQALEDVDRLILESRQSADSLSDVQKALLNTRIQSRLDQVNNAYQSFINLHPRHTRALMAYGSFLSDQGKEVEAAKQWKKAAECDPDNPVAWNNLANFHAHNGPATQAFDYYAKAVELAPTESLYYHNFGTTVYMFRQAAMTHFNTNQQGVFDKAMALYQKAVEYDPHNFKLATDVAQTYYGIKPTQTGDPLQDRQAAQALADRALQAWQYAMKLARDDVERQGVLLHYARIQINADRFEEARRHLNAITNSIYDVTKDRLLKKLESRESPTPPPSPQVP